jgi:hypothetical protein
MLIAYKSLHGRRGEDGRPCHGLAVDNAAPRKSGALVSSEIARMGGSIVEIENPANP